MNPINKSKFKKILTISITIISMCIAQKSFSQSEQPVYIDIFGTKKISAEDVKHRLNGDLQAISKLSFNDDNSPKVDLPDEAAKIGKKLKNAINTMGDFSYLHVTMTRYPNNANTYLTIDAADREGSQPAKTFLPRPSHTISDPDNLIATWEQYQEAGIAQSFHDKIAKKKFSNCPALNCTFGFDAPELKKYGRIFSDLVPKNKEQLIEVLRNDQNPSKRSDAAFLLAHIKNGKELIEILIPALEDSDMTVRSSVMEVLAGVTHSIKYNFPLKTTIDMLNSQDELERGSALIMLSSLSEQPNYAKCIKAYAKDQLITQLKMERPSVHDKAYQILLQISSYKFGDRDYAAWENWLNDSRSS